jgi:hypothetical protein
MTANANANLTYNVSTIREDLQPAYVFLDNILDTPLQSSIGRGTTKNRYFEWVEVNLAAPNLTNRVIEGENDPGNDAPTNGVRLANYTQISDMIAEVSSTAESVDGAGNIQAMAKQIDLKMKELRIGMEAMLLQNIAANAGAAGTARATAGLPAFLRTNVSRATTGTPGTNPTLSGTTAGFPNAAAGDGTVRALTETIFNDVIASCWRNGGQPSLVLCGDGVKRKISSSFTGTSTRYQEFKDKIINATVDIYVSDFGTLKVNATRYMETRGGTAGRDVLILDPRYAQVKFMQTMKQVPLAKTGHSERRMIAVEYGLQVDSEKAHGIVADINPAL